jgi:hypothetical protein
VTPAGTGCSAAHSIHPDAAPSIHPDPADTDVTGPLSAISCQTLLSPSLDTAFTGQAADRVGQPNTWCPVCMPFQLAQAQARALRWNADTAYRATLSKEMYGAPWMGTRSIDICAWPATENRYSASYQAPSRNDGMLRLLTQVEKTSLETEIISVRTQSSATCCGTNAACLTQMNAVRVEWCSSEATRAGYTTPDLSGGGDLPDDCIDNGTYYWGSPTENDTRTNTVNRLFTERGDLIPSAVAGIQGTYPFTPGAITLGPYAGVMDDSFGSQIRTIGHEFGHACSEIKQQLGINQGDIPTITQYREACHEATSCSISSSARSTYDNLFSQIGMSDSTRSCLFSTSAAAINQRFTSPQAPCENGCPRAYIEENVADWQAMMAISESNWIPAVIPEYCNYLRDAQHPWSWDVMACFIKTPTFADKVKRSTRCVQ